MQDRSSRLALYLNLIRWDRPAGWLLLLWPSLSALWIAADFGWTTAYTAMAVMVGVGIVTTLSISEPQPRVAQQSLAQLQSA